ncbi:MAG: saccharopine dehydrogenase [Bacteroidetes bacterium HGW-Bacteroidetes-4]|jgi:saccharopine dehydrogenase-like NADP-dependent oxidoreductase|nr:MAG: saccharopine dehydrogenase [Bacteroidetes bacterium HGW-Bacteroidetes-4]
MKKVLILGSGMVAGPIIHYLLNRNYFVTVASNTPERARELINNAPRGHAVTWSADEPEKLDGFIAEADLVVSLLPFGFHVMVAKKCIAHKKNMVTTSYVKPEMYALDEQAKKAGILILNECGLDPGIDHMSAKRIIDTVHGFGGRIKEFYSICGALPAPESSHDNPFRYKFSWSPKGVVLAGNNNALYLRHGKKVQIPTEKLFTDTFSVNVPGVEELQVYPNRDSVPYIDLYGIPETETMYRGTFRYKGWCEALNALKKLKLTLPEPHDFTGMSYAQLMARQINAKNTKDLKKQVADFLDVAENSVAIEAINFLGLFSDAPMNRKTDSTYEIVSDLMIERMMLPAGERDMSVMLHVFVAEYPDGRKEVIKSKLLDYGIPGKDTSIARTVALPAACAVRMILDSEIEVTGVHIPVIPEIYNPIMLELENLGIEMVEEYGLPLNETIL